MMLPPRPRTGTGWRWSATRRPRDTERDGGRSNDKLLHSNPANQFHWLTNDFLVI